MSRAGPPEYPSATTKSKHPARSPECDMFLSGVFTTWTGSPGSVQKESSPTCILQDIPRCRYMKRGNPDRQTNARPGLHMTMQQGAFPFTPKAPGPSESDPLLLLVRRPAMIATNYAWTQIKHYVSTPTFSAYFAFTNCRPIPAAEPWDFLARSRLEKDTDQVMSM